MVIRFLANTKFHKEAWNQKKFSLINTQGIDVCRKTLIDLDFKQIVKGSIEKNEKLTKISSNSSKLTNIPYTGHQKKFTWKTSRADEGVKYILKLVNRILELLVKLKFLLYTFPAGKDPWTLRVFLKNTYSYGSLGSQG